MNRKIISAVTALAMVLTILPAPMMATDGPRAAAQVNSTGTVGSVQVYVPENVSPPNVQDAPTSLTSQRALTDAWYIVNGAVRFTEPIQVKGDVNLILAENAELTVDEGIDIQTGQSLTIWSTSDAHQGKLIAKGKLGTISTAGIGSDGTGTITINGGTIEATGRHSSAGIGGHEDAAGGTITINAGKITATGDGGAGIGCGNVVNKNKGCGNITINGGEITAKGGNNCAGIGGTYDSKGGTIAINGGVIEKAQGGGSAAGIGSGFYGSSVEKITISGGTIEKALGGDDGAGIGSGFKNCTVQDITISGGTIINAKGGNNGAGIGSGYSQSKVNTLTISGGTIQNAIGGGSAAGIGSGYSNSTVTSLTISGGTIHNAKGGKDAAGIGTGYNDSNIGTLTISGGTIENALGGENGAGIGIGLNSTVNTFTTGTDGHAVIFATGGAGAAAISDQSQSGQWSGVIFQGTGGQVYGTPTITTHATIPAGKHLTVPTGKSLTIDNNTTLTINDDITNQGTVDNSKGGTSIKESPATVTYKVENGTWADNKTDDKTENVTLQADKKTFNKALTFTGTLASVPTGMQPADGYTGGAWNETPGTTINGDTTFIYTFGQYAPPIIKIDYEKEQLTGFVAGASYTIDNAVVTPTDTTVAAADYITNVDHSISIVRTGTDATASDAQRLDIPARPAAPSLEAEGTSLYGQTDGKITGLDSATPYVYKVQEAADWKDVPANQTAITGLAAGTYQVKIKATETSFASDATTVTIPEGPIPSKPTKPDKSETITNPDGSTTTVVTKPDGTVTSTTERTNGDVVEAVAKPDGNSTTTETRVDGTKVITQTTAAGKTTADVTLGEGLTEARVVIPVKGLTPDQVPVLVKPDGSREIIKKSYGNAQGETIVILHEDGTYEVIGNSVAFQDVNDSHWASPAIQFVSAREIFKGTATDTFSPELTMTRGMLVQVLYNFENQPQGSKDANFGDVASDAWFADAVDWAASNNIVSGVSDGHFAPNDNISREQLVTILYRYAGSPKVEGNLNQYSDASNVSDYAQDAMAWAVENGLVNGMGNNTLAPQGQATRAQVAQIIMHFCEWLLK